MSLRFSDGTSFDTSGPMRVELRKDGYYAVGAGLLIPASSYEDAENLVKQFSKNKKET